MTGARTQRKAFTLIELLITAAIFSIAALLATTVFSNVQTRQRQIQGKQRVTADGRYVIETIARSVRTGMINYQAFSSTGVATNPTPLMSTIDQNGQITCYRLNAKKVEILTNATTTCLEQSGSTWTAFTPEDLQVDALNFYVSPASDPYRSLPKSNADCRITTPVSTTVDGTSYIIQGYDSNIGSCACVDSSQCFSGQSCTKTRDAVVAPSTPESPQRNICTNPTIQPHVTIYIATSTKNSGVGEQSSSTLQTTVVSRVYQ